VHPNVIDLCDNLTFAIRMVHGLGDFADVRDNLKYF
jgi:hypothetical protein